MRELGPILLLAIVIFFGINLISPDSSTPSTPSTPDTSIVEAVDSNDEFNLKKEEVTVSRVIDGDTIIAKMPNGSEERIRLLLIDSPESVHPTEPVQKFGPEASDFAKKTITNAKNVVLEIGNPERDKYDRLLAYVWIDGKNFNELMIDKGFVRVAYIYPPNTKYLDEFQKAEDKAKSKKIGIWSIPGYATEKGFNMSVVP